MKNVLLLVLLLLPTISLAQSVPSDPAVPTNPANPTNPSQPQDPSPPGGNPSLPPDPFVPPNSRWHITKPAWTDHDEVKFGEFIGRLGEAVQNRECSQVDTCLRSNANPYAGTDPSTLRYFADCADLPYYLRSYFAWKNGLPMSVESGVSPRDPTDNPDVRYTKYGNFVDERLDVTESSLSAPNAVNLLNDIIINATWSASYRMIGLHDKGLYTDFYPVKLNRSGIHLGTVIYDPNGHVAIVYKVSDDGRVFYIDAHPDNTLTSGMYTPKFERSNPYQGAGFKNFRPLKLVGAKRNSAGNYIGGRIVGVPNEALPNYSLEQFYGTQPDPAGDWSKGQFMYRGVAFPYYDYVRIKMASGDLKIDPLHDTELTIADICTSLKDRTVAVNLAISAGMDQKPHPERLPTNIYGTDGDWELYSTSARDARLKVAYMDLLSQTKQYVQRFHVNDPAIVYHGANLEADLLAIYERDANNCQFSYTKTSGGTVRLNLEDARVRLFALSFDPYHCVELRWGASSPQELATCRNETNKMDWYSHEKWLRYQWQRQYDDRMDYALGELDGPKPGAGIEAPPDVDIVGYLSLKK
ncbi:MAG: hypothetical protein ACXVCY_09435 [Pseudobdellovibrionaceae bacterium]